MGMQSSWAWVKAVSVALAATIGVLALWVFRRNSEKLDEEGSRIEADRTRLQDAFKRGDDDEILREWRRSRGKKG